MPKIISLLFLSAIFSIAVFADIAPLKTPVPNKGKQVELMIDVTSEVNEPTLVIKKSSTKLLRAALDEAEAADSNLSQNESVKPSLSVPVQTVVGGMFLTFAFVFGGVWLVRSKKPSKTVIGLFLIGLFTTGTILVFANIAPPKIFGINKNIFSQDFQNRSRDYAKGKVRVKITADDYGDSDIKLLVPREVE